MTKRVLLAGLHHETHTFVDEVTTLADFTVTRGDQVLQARGNGSPLAAVIEYAQEAKWTLLPTIDVRATPSGTAEDAVVEGFWEGFREAALPELARGVDGMYLVLHGAMVSQSILDVEGEIIARIRALPGARDIPIAGVLDLHANVSARMAEFTQGLIAYAENPHVDAHAAAGKGARLLDRLMTARERAVTVWEHPPLIWPPPGTGTADDPMRTLEALARDIEKKHAEILAVNVHAGYSFADTPDTGLSFTAITVGAADEARRQLRRLTEYAQANRALGSARDLPIAEVMPKLRDHARGPVLLIEPSDNIGGAAPGDGTGVLRALLAHGVANAVVVINDPDAVRAISRCKAGEWARLSIGGKGSRLDPGPLELDVELLSTSNGRFDLEDVQSHLAVMSGRHIDMGPCAVVAHKGVRILLTTRKTPPFDLGQLRSQGIVPENCFVIGVKAAVGHRRAYDPITAASYSVDTPGPCSSDVRSFPFRHVRRPIYPLDPV